MFLDFMPMTTAKNVLENVSDDVFQNLIKKFLKSLDPVLLKAVRRGSPNTTFTDEQLSSSLSSSIHDVAQKFVKIFHLPPPFYTRFFFSFQLFLARSY